MPNPDEPTSVARSQRRFWILFLLIACVGVTLRVRDSASWRRTGPDELMYRRYVNLMDGYSGVIGVFPSDAYAQSTGQGSLIPYQVKIESTGAMAMPELVDMYLETQRTPNTLCELPPTRFLYIYTSWLWKRAQFGSQPPLAPEEMKYGKGEDYSQDPDHRDPALTSLHRVAWLFSVLLMLAGGLCAWRMLGPAAGLGVLTLMAFDPIQLHLSQHAMIDGFFAFWATMAIWTTWECLRQPGKTGWLIAHIVVLALMVMTKENAFFVYVALAVIVLANRWLRFGTVTPKFLGATFFGGLLGFTTLVLLAGGFGNFFEIYKTLVTKAQNLGYAQLTGDGPWYRYLVDLMTMNPLILCLAIGGVFAVAPGRKELGFLALFIVGSYLVMCNVRYGMNLRYASVWSLPLAALAFAMIWQISARFAHRQWLVATILVAGLAAYELRQYMIFAGDPDRPLYELVPNDLLHLVKIIKS
jgi:hypothetical protein